MTRASDLAKLLTGGRTLGGTGEVIVKDIDTADGSSPKITLQTGDTDIASADVLGTIDFQAPDEGTGTDAILVAAGIEAVSEGDFSSSSNATSLVLKTGASEAATEKVRVQSDGKVGISNTSPVELLTIGSTSLSASRIQFLTSTSGANTIHFGDGTSADAYRGYINYAHGTDSLELATSGNLGLKIDANGHVTKPLQPAFSATPLTGASAQSNLSTGSDVTIVLGNEIFDVNGDFASNTFTAPVTGKYHLSANIALNHLDMDASSCRIEIKTSNRSYTNNIDPDAFNEDADIITLSLTVVADMDASDTAIVIYYQDGGSAQTDVMKAETSFSGCLLA